MTSIYCLFQVGPTCWRACLATILRVGLDDLPATIDSRHDDPNGRIGSGQLGRTRRALRHRGLDLVREKPEQETITPAAGLAGELVVAGVLVEGHAHAVVAVDVDGVLWSLWDPDCGSPRESYAVVDVTRLVAWPRPSRVAAAVATSRGVAS